MFPKSMTPPNNNGYRIVIAGALVIAGPIVIAGLTRNPVVVWHWIPDQVRDDNCRVRDDNCGVRDDNWGARDDSY